MQSQTISSLIDPVSAVWWRPFAAEDPLFSVIWADLCAVTLNQPDREAKLAKALGTIAAEAEGPTTISERMVGALASSLNTAFEVLKANPLAGIASDELEKGLANAVFLVHVWGKAKPMHERIPAGAIETAVAHVQVLRHLAEAAANRRRAKASAGRRSNVSILFASNADGVAN